MLLTTSAFPQTQQIIQELTPIAAFDSAHSATFEMKIGDSVRVTGTTSGGSEFGIVSYVYRETRPDVADLVAVDDPDVIEPAFQWTAYQDGRYHVIVRSVSSVAGKYKIVLVKGARDLKIDPRPDIPRPPVNPQPNVPPLALNGDAVLATVKIFYATNRKPANPGAKVAYFTGEPAAPGTLAMGTCLVTLPRDHRMGEVEGPSIYKLEFSRNPAKHVVLKSVTPETNRQKFFAAIAAKASETSKREAFVFIHGFNVPFEDAAMRTAQISYDLGFTGAPILFSWPSQGALSPLEYTRDGRNADISAVELKSFLEVLTSNTGVRTVHLIAHSMGNRVLSQALDQIAAARSDSQVHFREIALMAPDVDAELFRQMSQRFKGKADRITLYASSKDDALKASQKLAGFPRAGQVNPDPLVLPGIDTIDASAVDTSLLGLDHSYYGDNQTILSDLFYLLRDSPPGDRARLRQVTIPSGAFWRFSPAVR